MRLAALSAVLLAAGYANAQSAFSRMMQAYGKAVEGKHLPSGAGTQNPLEPSGFPQPPSRDGELPPPRAYGPEERAIQIVSPNNWRARGSHISATGGIHAIYKGYDIFGGTLEGDTQTEVFTLTGNVKVIGKDSVVNGERVTVDFRANTFNSDNSEITLRPSLLQGRALADVYFRGVDTFGSEREVFGNDSSLTTCNYDDPHYAILADKTDVRPGKRIIFRGVRIRVLSHDILRLPYLSIPLERHSDRYLPTVGHSPQEGYWIKSKIPIALKGNDNFLDARVDYYTKLGNAIGADYDYTARNIRGNARVYGILQSGTFNADIHHDQRFGLSELQLDGSFQRSNYLVAPDSTLVDTRAQYILPQRNGSLTRLSFNRNSNSSPSFSAVQQQIGLSDNRIFTPSIRTNLDLTLSDTTSSSTGFNSVQSKELDVRFSGVDDLKRATAELNYQRNIPIGTNNNTFFTTADQTPVFYLRTDAGRLLPPRLATEIPFQAELSYGNFATPRIIGTGAEHITRQNLNLGFSRPDHPQRRFDVSADGRFQQGIYSDDAAQYITGLDTVARYSLGPDTAFNVRYSYLQQHGFTPLEFDRTGRTNVVSSDLSFRPIRSLLIGAQTGYDFLQLEQQNSTAWQTLGLRAEWRPRDYFQVRSLATYDPYQRGWSNIRFDIGYRPGATYLSLGVQYDGIRKTLGNMNLFVDGLKWGRLKTSAILDYNGYLRKFNATHFAFTYDLHCADLIVQVLDNQTGFRPGTQVSVFLRLKAFPFTTPFGIGTRGQAVGGGSGRPIF